MSKGFNRPLLRWVGGKRWFVDNYSYLFPCFYNAYHEPFFGSGAVFFYLNPVKAFVSDKNHWLMDTYEAIQKDYEIVEKYLKIYQKNHTRDFYYETRKKKHRNIYRRSAQLIYLNRTCWNGLFRVNRSGEFNVPIGTRDNIFRAGEMEIVGDFLKNAEINSSCFTDALKKSCSDDFVFIDPPYTAKHNDNGFVKYNEKLFSWDDQVILRNIIEEKSQEGVKFLVLNANHESVKELYSNLGEIHVLSRASTLSSSSAHRGKTTEIAVKIGY